MGCAIFPDLRAQMSAGDEPDQAADGVSLKQMVPGTLWKVAELMVLIPVFLYDRRLS